MDDRRSGMVLKDECVLKMLYLFLSLNCALRSEKRRTNCFKKTTLPLFHLSTILADPLGMSSRANTAVFQYYHQYFGCVVETGELA